MNNVIWGQRIRMLRERKRLTQEQLAGRAEVSTSFLGHIERGTRVASVETLLRLCAALDVTPNDILGTGDLAALGDMPDTITVSPRELLQNIALLLRKQGNP